MKFIHLLLFSITILLGYCLFITPVKADLDLPNIFEKKCKTGEKEIVCEYRIDQFGLRAFDECRVYKNNSSYYFLINRPAMNGGQEIYCLLAGAKPVVNFSLINYFLNKNTLIVLLATLLIEVSLAVIMGYRKFYLLAILLINLVTTPLANYILIVNSTYNLIKNQTVILIFLECFIIAFEWGVLKLLFRKTTRSLITLSLFMNWTSFMIGLVLALFLQYISI
jgi:hypothetical protein